MKTAVLGVSAVFVGSVSLVAADRGTTERHHIRVETPPSSSDVDSVLARRWQIHDWKVRVILPSPRLDSLAKSPQALIARNDGVVMLDGGSGTLLYIASGGDVRWRYASADDPATSVHALNDTLYLNHNSSASVEKVIAPGRVIFRGATSRSLGAVEFLVPLTHSEYAAVLPLNDPPFIGVDKTLRPARTISVNWPNFFRLNPLVRSGIVASDGRGETWVYALLWGSGWISFTRDSPRSYIGRYVDAAPTPAVIIDSASAIVTTKLTRHVQSIYDVALRADTFFVLRAQGDTLRGRVVDKFRLRDGKSTFPPS